MNEYRAEKGSKESVMRFFWVLKNVDWAKKKKRMWEFRKPFSTRFVKRD